MGRRRRLEVALEMIPVLLWSICLWGACHTDLGMPGTMEYVFAVIVLVVCVRGTRLLYQSGLDTAMTWGDLALPSLATSLRCATEFRAFWIR